jgi:hypothetical protein
LFKDIDMICHLDDNNRVGKPPDKIHERTKSKQERNERLIAGKHGSHEGLSIGNNSDPQGVIAFMTGDMHRFVGDTYYDDNGDDDGDDNNFIDGNDIDDDVDTLDDEEDEEREEAEEEDEEEEEEEEEEEGTKIDENTQHKKRISTPDSSEWGTCPNCKGCGFVGNICSECNEDGMKFEHHPKWYYKDTEVVIHMTDITSRIICGEALVSIVIGKVMLRTPKTAVKNFLHSMAMESLEPDVEHSIDSRLELFKLCGMTTVSDVVGHCDCMYERTGEMTLAAVCNPEYQLLCEIGAIWFVHQHCMQPSHHQSFMTTSQRCMFQDNRRDMSAVIVEAERNNSVSDNISMDKYLWHGDSGASCHESNDTGGIFDHSRINSYLKIGNGKYLYSIRIDKKKVTIVKANDSTLDLILRDSLYVPDICINLKDYKGSTYNVLVTWEPGESTYEPLNLIASEPGWKRFLHYTRNKNKLGHIVNQNKVSTYCLEPFWMFVVLVPRTHKQAMELDMKHNDKKCQDAYETDMHQLLKYHCKGVVIDIPACEQCSSIWRGVSIRLHP